MQDATARASQLRISEGRARLPPSRGVAHRSGSAGASPSRRLEHADSLSLYSVMSAGTDEVSSKRIGIIDDSKNPKRRKSSCD